MALAALILLLSAGPLAAQSVSVLEWNFGTTTYTNATSIKHAAVSTGTVVLNANSGASLTVTGIGTTSDRQMQVGSWNGTETTTLISGRTSTTPVSASKVLYTAFTVNSAAGGDWSAMNLQLGYQRTATNDPTKVRAYLTWQEAGTWRTRYSAIATLAGTTMTTLNLPLNAGSAAPTALAGNTFLLELHFWGTSSSPNKVNVDNVKFQVNNLDFPDFGDSSNITTNASSFANSRLRLGAVVDSESTAITNTTATGDDATGTDDEDGVTLAATLTQGQPATLTANVTNSTGAAAYLNAWIDFNRNGVLTDSGEQIASNVAIATGTSGADQSVNFTVPTGASIGAATVRVRLSSTSSPGPTGASGSGEVEDSMVTFVAPTLDYGDDSDFGDAFAVANTNLRLGALVDAEYAATSNTAATGDNTTGSNDEDGVTIASLVKGRTATITMTVTNASGSTGYLNGWIDWNNNGVLTDAGEQVVVNTAISTGTSAAPQTVTIDVPVSATAGTVGARFRFGSVSNPGATGDGGTGEVEDYAVTVSAPPPTDFAVVIVNYNNNSISRFNGTDGALLATWTPTGLSAPNYGYRLSDNTLLVANGSANTITKYNPFTGAYLGTLIGSGNGLNFPYQMAIGPEGLVYIANQNGNNILKFNGSTGTPVTSVASLTSPAGLAFDTEGKIYVTQNISGGPLKIYSTAGVLQSTVYTWPSGESPRGLAWGPDGRLYVNVRDGNAGTGRVDAFTFPGGTRSVFVTMDAGSNPYTGIKWGPDGNLYVVDYGESQVQVYSPAGAVVRTLTTGLSGPHAVAFTDLSANTLDYGDFTNFGMAASTQNTALKLGNEVDTESASRLSATANGDDIDDLDDEDGVTLPVSVSAGAMTSFTLKVTNTSGAAAYLNAWWDFNRNGSLTDSGEKIINNVTVANGTSNVTQTYTVSIPVGASLGLAGLRFRLTSTSNPGATGTSGSGEVEDYTVTINAQGSDFGDFSSIASASSTVNNSLRLGALVDVESSATSNTSATGDDTTGVDDEDGVTVPASIPQGTSVTIPVSVLNNTGANAYLSAWIDFNNDGTLNNALVSAGGERLEAERTISANAGNQSINVTFTSPATAGIGTGRGMRFRLSSASGAGPSGTSGTGEVEDYTVSIVSGLSIGNLVWNDANDNGLKDVDESGINNVQVELWTPGADNAIGGTSTNADTKVATVNTSGGGLYSFTGLSAGKYFVKVPTPPLSRVSSVVDVSDDGEDNDNSGAQPGGSSTAAYSPVIQLTAGQEPGSTGTGNAETTIDFGFVSNIGSPFVCDNRFYVMQNAETSAGSGVWDSTLYYIGPAQELIPVFIFEGYKLNGLAAYGGYLYCIDQNGNHLYRINAAGTLVDMGAVPGLPSPGTGGQWSGATALTNGRMILNQYVFSPSQIVLYTLDLGTLSLVGSPVVCVNAATGTTMASNFGDIAWDPISNKVYGYNTVDTSWLGLFEINTSTGVCTRVAAGEAGSFGSLVIDANGLAYGYGSAGASGAQDTLWVFNRTNGVLNGSMTAVGNGPDVSNSDGAACPGAAPSMKIGSLVWNDANNNGIKDTAETGIDGVVVNLFLGGNNPLSATPLATVTTSGGGAYSFNNLSPGQYFVYIPTPPASYPLSSSVTDTADNGEDNDDNGIQTASGMPVSSPLMALTAGTEPITDGDTDANTDLTIDFGFRACPTIVVAPATLPAPVVGTAYTQTFTASGGTSPYTWSLASGALPTWATLSGTTGSLTGTPTATTSATFTIRGTDALGCSGVLSYTLTPACTTITVLPSTLPQASINTAYSQATAFSASGMPGSYTFSASSLPTGMTFDATNKKLTGTPTAAGLFNVAVTATSASYTACAGTVTVPFRVCPLISLSPTTLGAGLVGTAYSQSAAFGGAGGTAPYSFTVTGIPPGLSYDTASRKLIGTPTTSGSYNVQVSALDANGCPAVLIIPFTIACPTITVAPSTLPPATIGTSYAQLPAFSATGLTGTYTWTAASLPTGMSFDAASKKLTGTPTATGVFNVTATATDSTYANCSGAVTVPFRVCPVISISPVSLGSGMVGAAYSQATAFSAAGGTAPYTFGTPTGLPAGMTWDSVNLKITGTPTLAGTSNVALTVTDSNGCPGALTVSLVIVAPFDYGDYPGFASASQTASTELRIGTNATDYENANPATGLATADDTTGTDDEDLTMPNVSPGFSTSVTIPVTLSGAVASGRLMVWADWNGDNAVTGANEIVTSTAATLVAGTNNVLVTFSPPASTSIGTKYVRLIATEGTSAPSFSGSSSNRGEVEDYPISVVLHNGCDYGDLPDTGAGTGTGNYKTVQSDSGAAHLMVSGLVLGATIDTETDALQNTTATGDGADDDGLVLPAFVKDASTALSIRASNSSGSAAYLSVWIDWNNNGSFEDAGEKMAGDVLVANGTSNAAFAVNFTVPASAVLGAQTAVRVRLSQTSGLLSYGLAMSGEVEDYLSSPVVQGITVGDLVWNDVNNDGTYQSATEAGLSGVTVTALGFGADNIQGTGDDTTTATTSAAGGAYSLVLAPGKYIIRVTPPGAYPLASAVVVSADNGVNNDNNGAQTGGVNQPVNSPTITLAPNTEPGSAGGTNVENTIDFGLRACPTVAQGAAGSWTATQYVAYSQTITASGGVAPYTWSRSGTLPGGLTFTDGTSSATIIGTPDGSLTVGNYAITVTATDALGCSSTQNFTLVLACPVIAVAGSLPTGTQDTLYDQTLTASGGTGPYTWSVVGTLPAGLTASTPTSTTFRLSGTPTTVESRTFTVRATDKWGCVKDSGFTVAIGCPVITISPDSPLAGITQYATMTNVVFSAVGGRTPYVWSIDSTTPLPAGLTFTPSTATLSGIPTAAPGTYNFNVKLVDSSGCPASKPYAITIACPAVTVSTASPLAAGTAGTAYTQTLAATTAGTGVPAQTYTWSVSSGTLPPGLALSSAGVLSGTPTLAGTYSFTVRAANQQSCAGTKALSLSISCPTITLTPATLPAVAKFASYSQTFGAGGGTAPYTYSVLSGTVPVGLTLTGATLSGTVTAAPGSYAFTMKATDNNGCTGTLAYTVVVNCPTIALTPASVGPFTQYSAITNVVFAASGGTSPYTWSIDSATPLPTGLAFNAATATLSGTATAAPGSYTVNVKVTDANSCPGNRSYTVVINCNTVSLAPGTLSSGVVGTAYSQTVGATLGGSGVPAQTWTYSITSGALPAGLALNSSTGAITGTPTGVVAASFTLRAANAQGCAGSLAYTLNTACPALAINTGSTLTEATQFTAYGNTLSAAGGTQPYTWSVLSGALPAGLSLNGSTGIISGTATAAIGTYVFTLQVVDAYGCSATKPFNLVLQCPVITITPGTLPGGTQYAAYSQTLTATTTGSATGSPPFTWSVSSGVLPAGLSLVPSAVSGDRTAAITGTPTKVESQTFTVQVKDSNNCIGVQTYTLAIDCPPITITPATVPGATQYAPYSQAFSASGGTAPYAWALDTGSNALPSGLTLSTGGLLSGTPTAGPGNYAFRIVATDANNCPGYQSYTLSIGCPTLTFSSSTLPSAQAGVSYSQAAAASGGTAPYTFTLISGTLPAGLSFNGSNGAITGIPNVMPGTFAFTLRATDNFGCTGTQSYSIAVTGRDYGDYSGVGSASSLINSTLRLGASIDPESSGITNSTATADDVAGLVPDDEDGVVLPQLCRGQTAVVKVAVNNGSGSPAYVSGWIDFNNSGAFDAGEQFATDALVASGVSNGTLSLPVAVPGTAVTGSNLAARVRLSGGTARAATGDDSASGEVEDYLVQVLPAVVGVGNVVFKDSNANKRYDAGEGTDGVLVQLFAQGGSVALASTTTSGGGRYLFNDLAAGSYFVKIPSSEFGSGKPLFNTFSVIGNGGDTGVDDATDENGIDVSNAAAAGVVTGVFALSAGGEALSRPGTELGMDAHSDDGQIVSVENNAGNTGIVVRTYQTLNDYYGGNALATVAGAAAFGAGSFKDLTYDPTTARFIAWLSSGNLVAANSISDLVTATGTYTNTASAFNGFGVTNFGKTLGIEMVGSTVYTIETNSGGTGIVGRTYTSLTNWYAGTVSSTASGAAAFGATSFRGLGYDRVSGLFYGYYDPSGNGSGQVVTAASISDLVGATGTYTNLGNVHFGTGITNYSKTLGVVNMPAVTTGDSNIDLTMDLGFAPCQTITISPASLAAVTQYTPMTSTTLTASGGNAPYTWSLSSGALPAGLSLTSAGVLAGNPTAAPGTYNFTVQAVDAYSCSGTKAYSITVSCPTIAISPATLPAATQYAAYSLALAASTSGTGVPAQSYTWSLSSGSLPAGLALNTSTGLISGTPTGTSAPGNYPITVRVQNASGCYATAGYTLVLSCPAIIVDGTLVDAVQDVAYTGPALTASGGTAPYTFTVVGSLPTGLTLNSSTGVISGTPTVVQSATFTIRAADVNGCAGTRNYTIAVGCPVITISPASPLNPVTQYTAMTGVVFSAVGGRTPYAWSIDSATPLPAGLTFSTSTATLSGTPTAASGVYNFTVKLVDASGCPATKSYSLTVNCPNIAIAPSTLSNGTVGTAYSRPLVAAMSGTNVPVQTWGWSLASGALPAGLSLNSSSGAITGTPTTAGSSTFTVRASTTLAGGNPELEFCTYNLDLNPGDVFNIRDYIHIKDGNIQQPIDWSLVQLTYTLGGANDPVVPANWHLTEFNAGQSVTVTAADMAAGTGNSGTGEYRIYLLRNGQASYDDHMTIRISTTQTSAVNTAKCNPLAQSFVSCSGTQAYTVTVACPSITLSPGALPAGYVNGSYAQAVTASGGTAPYSYAITSGTLPAGLAFNTSNGTISGIPTATASTTITIRATDFYGCTGSISYPLTIKTMGIGNLVYSDCNNSGTYDAGDTGLAGAVVQLYRPGADNSINTADDVQVGAGITTNATGAYSFSSIPPGNYFVKVTPPSSHQKSGGMAVTLDNRVDDDNNGAQSAIGAPLFSPLISLADGAEPTADGDGDSNTDWTVDFGIWSGMTAGNLVWNDANNNGVKDSGESGIAGITVDLMSPGTDNAPGGTGLNADSVVATTATAGDGTYGFRVYTMGSYFVRVAPGATYPLPSGVSVASDNGVDNDNNGISQPGLAGTSVNTMVFALSGCETEDTIDIGLRGCPTISVSPGSLAAATLGDVYASGSIAASGGTAPYTWSIVSGALPTGLALGTTSSTTSAISGTPSGAANSYNVTLQVRDALGCVATRAYAIAVSCPVITITPATLPVAYQGAVFSQTLVSTGSVGAVTWSVSPALPAGLALGASTGIISGTPTAPVGTYNVTVTSNDSNNCQASISYAISVRSMGIGNLVWYDCDNDGVKDSTESGLAGAVVTLFRSGADNTVNTADDVAVGASVTTAASGAYSFASIPPGNYYVKVVPPAGYSLTGGSPVALDNRVDNDNNGVQSGGLGSPAYSAIINLADGAEPTNDGDTNASTDWTVDFGFWTGFTVGDRVWVDTSGDGIYQSGTESGVSGLTVELLTPGSDNAVGGSGGAADTVVATTITSATGTYGFTVYVAGNYYVRVSPNATYPLAGFASVQTDNGVDGDNNGVQPGGAGSAITSMVFSLVACTEPAAAGAENIENTIDFAVRSCPTITLSPVLLAGATQYQSYSQTLTASGAVAPYTWAVVSGALPAGITLTTASSTTATLTGNATALPGTYNFTVRATDALLCTGTRAYSVVVSCPTISMSPSSVPTATQFVPYSQAFTASTAGTGVPAQTYTWSLSSGTLPAGLSLNPANGTISGTPTGASAPGSYPFTLRVQDANACFATGGYTLVLGCPAVSIAGTLADGVQDTVYTPTTLSASGGTGPYVWSVVGAMPTGMVLNSSTGVVSGTPTVVQSATFTVKATDSNGCVGTKNYTIAVGCPVITINPVSPLNPVTQYVAMSNVVFSAVGGRAPYAWSIDSATPLPAGLSFAPATATLSGTATATPGVYNFTVKLVDSSGCPGSKSYSLTVNCPAITIVNDSPLPNGVVGTPYSQTLTASMSGTGVPAQTYTYSLASGTLPAGLSLSSAGVISGTPSVPSSATVTVQATNTQGCVGTKAMSLTVVCPTISLSPSTLVSGYVNGAYSATVSASGGTAPYVYAITSGTLPNGLSFNTGTGSFSGTPTTVGSATLVIRATDSYGCTGNITYPMSIRTMGIGNLVWDDCNNNGLKDLTESGLAGAVVQLFRSGADNMVNTADDVQVGGTQVTTGSGAYSFTNIPPGNYFVKVTPPSTHQKSGGSPVGIDSRNDNDNNGMQSAIGAVLYSPIIGLADSAEPTNDGDTDANTDWTVDFGVYSGVRAGNLVWADDDQDGLKDASEAGIGGLTVQLMNPGSDNAVGGTAGAADTVVATTTTAPDGSFGFLVYTPGNYCIAVTPNSTYMLPSLNPVALDNGVDNDNNAVSQQAGAGTTINSSIFTLSGCETDNTIDMALRPCPILTVTPNTIGPVTQYTPVKVNLDVTGGTEPYTWSVQSGVLPEGLNLNTIGPATAVVSGNPTAIPATYNVTIRVRDALGCVLDVPYPILVMCPTITLTPDTLPAATQYVAYSAAFSASTDGVGVPVQTYTWSITGALPAGLNFNSSTGVLSGTPSSTSEPGSYPITVRVQDGSGCYTTRGLTLELLCPQVSIAGAIVDGVQDGPYSVPLTANGGTSPYSWTVLGTLPVGLTLTPTGSTTAVLAGTPDMVESVMFTVIATDAHGCQATRPSSIAINCPPIIISPATLPGATQYTVMPPVVFSAVGGRTPYVWSIDPSTPVPAGLTFNAATATLSGTPTGTPGVYPLNVRLVDKSGCPGSNAYLLTIACPTVTVAPTTLPSGTVGTAYSQTLSASMSGTGVPAQTWTWTLDSGTLPAGLTLNSATGVLAGTPSVTATANITVRATNAQGCAGTQAFTLVTSCPGMAVTPGVLPEAVQYAPGYSQAIVVTGGTAPYTWSISGSLPAGLTLNTSTGVISGTVTAAAASFPISVTVSDSFGCSATKAYTLVVQSIDHGDLTSLPTAGNYIVAGLKMGNATVDADTPSQANATATGDDTVGVDDEDGVTFPPLTIGTTVLVSVKVSNTSAAPAYLNGWIDFNGNGTLEEGERIVAGQIVNAGTTGTILDFSVPIPGTVNEQPVAARFRLSSDGAAGVGGVSGNGETEDYIVPLCQPRPCGKTYVSQN